jgi:hypothetical protein
LIPRCTNSRASAFGMFNLFSKKNKLDDDDVNPDGVQPREWRVIGLLALTAEGILGPTTFLVLSRKVFPEVIPVAGNL